MEKQENESTKLQKEFSEKTGKSWKYREWMGDSTKDYVEWLEKIIQDLRV